MQSVYNQLKGQLFNTHCVLALHLMWQCATSIYLSSFNLNIFSEQADSPCGFPYG